MRLDYYKCEECKKAYDSQYGFNLEIPIDKEMDASGNGYNTIWKHIDICKNCAEDVLIKHYGERLCR